MAEQLFWPLSLGVLGAIAGSFLATIVVRWPQGRSVLSGRSACDTCGTTLTPIELIPIISALLQNGRCRTCEAPIAGVHREIELGCALIGVAAAIVAPDVRGVAGAIFGWLLLTLATLDFLEMWLPDALTGTLAVTGILAGIVGVAPSVDERVLGGIAGFVGLWGVATGYRLVRKRDGLGGGDPKLFGAIGLWLGWQLLPAVLLLAALIGLGIVLTMLLRGRRVAADDALPFGALLAIAAYPAWLMMIGFDR